MSLQRTDKAKNSNHSLVLLSFIPSAGARPILPATRWPPIQPRRSFETPKILFSSEQLTQLKLSALHL
ncbi:hypothetical protein LMH87_003616 [Akanthomyces muscarius]|uniref:Uncharacterized protein n=1 Tax=Akanthomyces muscarius TaxID=2231603 RepID=A0A9W8Q2X8_AKAMU|nr:hypothetical protein LMH87_003616 [Akanthomyces muscarius]KAJ4144745.1 hypothetical protein LMH87_003616 [Akanthomyces muscarius]